MAEEKDDKLQGMWEGIYKEYGDTESQPDEEMIKIVSPWTPGKALDLGAGEGQNAFWLAEKGWKVVAVDYAPSACKLIEERGKSKDLLIEARVGDILSFVCQEPQDLVVLGFIHLPAEDRKTMLKNCARSLAPGGKLLYIGLTNETFDFGGIDPAIFADAATVTHDIKVETDLEIVESKQAERLIDVGDGEPPKQKMGVTILAAKPNSK
eukprot:m.35669 g.35669  ORF g.35669 m.35669 type:complete len:209 (+) comp14425_c0_seq1:101-727(+)